jgi:hypothetical protein
MVANIMACHCLFAHSSSVLLPTFAKSWETNILTKKMASQHFGGVSLGQNQTHSSCHYSITVGLENRGIKTLAEFT